MGNTYSQGVTLAFTLNKLQPVLGSDTNSITSEVLSPLKIYIMVLRDNMVYSSYSLFYCFVSFCTCVCVSFSASILKDQKHSVMITFENNNNTESGNPSHFQKKKHNIYRLCLTLQFETPLLLTQWSFASGLNVGTTLQEILLAVIQLKHRKMDIKCLGLQYTQCQWQQPPLKWNYYSTTNDLQC